MSTVPRWSIYRRYWVITVDVSGHGPLAWPEVELSIGQAARRIRSLLERLGTGLVLVIGVSMGAAVAIGNDSRVQDNFWLLNAVFRIGAGASVGVR